MLSLALRNLFFTILQPGLVAGVIPYYILGNERVRDIIAQPMEGIQIVASIFFIVGFIVMIMCIVRFATEGRGTLSPVDPTKKLVTNGLYQYSRNPMYVGVMVMLAGEALYTGQGLWIYTVIIFVAFNIFILIHEEPRLKKTFGEEYEKYCNEVGRWI